MKKTERKPKPAATSDTSSQNSSPEAGEYLTLTEIKELIELISEKQFNEFELERGSFRLRLQKGTGKAVVEASPQLVAAPTVVSESRPVGPSAPAAQPSPATVPASPEEKLHIINSPIVGTFFRAPSPTADPFVKIGDEVEAGMTICIIEAMKLMNEITSDAAGTVAKIYVENGQPVEYGQPLFGIKV
jgi:acetyl-CoA carboxylase biotin carboxyl carrier protein